MHQHSSAPTRVPAQGETADAAAQRATDDGWYAELGRRLRLLDGIDDPEPRAVLDQHQRVPMGSRWVCRGCDQRGHGAGPAVYPCWPTVLIADAHQIDLDAASIHPAFRWATARPLDGSFDAPTTRRRRTPPRL